MNPPLNQEPLSDEQLNHLFKQGKAQPPADWQERFWLDLEPQLESQSKASPQLAKAWFQKPWMAAAAGFLIVLLALPLAPSLFNSESSTPTTSEDKAMTLGAGIPDEKQEAYHPHKEMRVPQASQPGNSAPQALAQADFAKRKKTAEADEESPQEKELMLILSKFGGQMQVLPSKQYEVIIPQSSSADFEAVLKTWPVKHNLLERALHQKNQIIYRIEILP